VIDWHAVAEAVREGDAAAGRRHDISEHAESLLRSATIDDCLKYVAETRGVPLAVLLRAHTDENKSQAWPARVIVDGLAARLLGLSMPTIGQGYGMSSHSSAYNRILKWDAIDEQTRQAEMRSFCAWLVAKRRKGNR
jgi:chromosomal replication initiation ATPase DnaA